MFVKRSRTHICDVRNNEIKIILISAIKARKHRNIPQSNASLKDFFASSSSVFVTEYFYTF